MDDIKVTGTIKEWKDGEVTLASPVFGEATFKADAFKIIEFNLGKPRNSASINTKPQNSVIDRAHAIRAAQEARVPAQVAEGIAQELEIGHDFSYSKNRNDLKGVWELRWSSSNCPFF